LTENEKTRIHKLSDKVLGTLDQLSSYPMLRRSTYLGAMGFFVAIILIPPIIGIFLKWNLIGETLQNAAQLTRAQNAVVASFVIALLVAILDLLAGLPMAWLIVKRKAKWISIIDSLADVPFIIPTVALGYSILTFWSGPTGIADLLNLSQLFSPGPVLIILLHFAFCYPVIVRLMVGEFQSYNQIYETAARTLGASTLTAFRTVTMPILKPAMISAFLLAFSRSLSETGATAIVAGTFENGPLFIRNARALGQDGPMVLVSSILIGVSVAIFAAISYLGPKLGFPSKKVWTGLEHNLSKQSSAIGKDLVTMIVFIFLVVIPSLFVVFPSFAGFFDGTIQTAFSGSVVWTQFWSSLSTSYVVAIIATLLNLLIGFPMAIIIGRQKMGKRLTALLDALVTIPVIIPSVALGVSLSIFWNFFGGLPDFWVLVLAHTTITYTYFTRPMAAAIQGVPQELEEVGRTLGSRPFGTFRKLVLPLTKYSIFSSSVMVLTRSVAETGATVAVVGQNIDLQTAPVLLVKWISNPSIYSSSTVGLGILFLVLLAFVSLLALRLAMRKGGH
jgi:thiamine transport system permease protein